MSRPTVRGGYWLRSANSIWAHPAYRGFQSLAEPLVQAVETDTVLHLDLIIIIVIIIITFFLPTRALPRAVVVVVVTKTTSFAEGCSASPCSSPGLQRQEFWRGRWCAAERIQS